MLNQLGYIWKADPIQLRCNPDPRTQVYTTTSLSSGSLPPFVRGTMPATRDKKKSKATRRAKPKPDSQKIPSTEISQNLTSVPKSLRPRSKRSKTNTSEELILSATPSLPNEILQQILSHLSGHHSTLYAWCLASKRFYDIGYPVMSRHLRLSPWMSDSGDGRHVLDPKKIKVGRLISQRTTGMEEPFDFLPVPENVRILTVRDHPWDWCHQGPMVPLKLPNLDTIHLHLDYDCKFNVSMHRGYSLGECHFLAGSRPKNLVIRHSSNSCIHQAVYLHRQGNPWDAVEGLIIVTPSFDFSIYGCYTQLTHLKTFAYNLKHVYWICDPSPLPNAGGQAPHNISSTYPQATPADWIANLACKLFDVPLSMVNFSTVCMSDCDPTNGNVPFTSAQVEQLTKQEVPYYFKSDPQGLKARLATIHFINLKEYLDTEIWWDIFEPEEIKRWIKYTE
ncbi:hypothetical protein IAU59_005163 [Kwoniella sp. CBS 9459]